MTAMVARDPGGLGLSKTPSFATIGHQLAKQKTFTPPWYWQKNGRFLPIKYDIDLAIFHGRVSEDGGARPKGTMVGCCSSN